MGMYRHERRPVVDCSVEPDRAVQSEKRNCDINFIVGQYRKTGVMPHVAARMPSFADVSDVGDFRELVDRVEATKKWFGKLPAKVRAAFDNDPVALMDSINDPSQQAKLEGLGLTGKKVEAAKAGLEAAAGSPPA